MMSDDNIIINFYKNEDNDNLLFIIKDDNDYNINKKEYNDE